MKTILFLMFFVTPPAEKGKELWSLQNTNTLEFSSVESCVKVGAEIQTNLSTVDTIAVRAWCFNESEISDPKIMSLVPEPKYELSIDKLVPAK